MPTTRPRRVCGPASENRLGARDGGSNIFDSPGPHGENNNEAVLFCQAVSKDFSPARLGANPKRWSEARSRPVLPARWTWPHGRGPVIAWPCGSGRTTGVCRGESCYPLSACISNHRYCFRRSWVGNHYVDAGPKLLRPFVQVRKFVGLESMRW